MTKIITRFAPSPTGMLHIGNSRTALINWLYAKAHNGLFILRFDDTDLERSKQQYKETITQDLKFLGLNWDQEFTQSSRLDRYKEIKDILIDQNRLYQCFETQEELDLKRKLQLSRSMPPIYDRHCLNLSQAQIDDYLAQGRKPHYRFLINHETISWHDMVKGEIKHQAKNLSDPIVIRENASMTYMLCSVIDDIDYGITHIIRGEDHATNTAIQVQMFEALAAALPEFGHLSLVISKDDKISKRIGGFEIATLRDEIGLESMAINSFFGLLGSSMPIAPFKTLDSLIKEFDITKFSKSPTTYQPEELERLNHKLLIHLSFDEIKDRLKEINAEKIDEQFWLAVRPNLKTLREINIWWDICHSPEQASGLDQEYLKLAADLLDEGPLVADSWGIWTKKIAEITGKKGKDLFLPLRLAITGMASGPEMANILQLISRKEVIKRLQN